MKGHSLRKGRPVPFGFQRRSSSISETINRKDSLDKEIIDPVRDLEQKRKSGVKIFASSYKTQFLENSNFADYMYGNYGILVENKNYIIFDLSSKLAP